MLTLLSISCRVVRKPALAVDLVQPNGICLTPLIRQAHELSSGQPDHTTIIALVIDESLYRSDASTYRTKVVAPQKVVARTTR